ncbi:MAG: hypothetical protein ACP5KS_11255, partial [Candidatus Hydrogenedens sp.]
MKKIKYNFFFIFFLISFTCYSWGPTSQISIVSNAIHLIDKELNASLKKLENEIKNGAAITDETFYMIVPTAKTNLIQAIESEMNLLIAVKPKRIDPYYAFRLGVLGKLIV